MDDSICDWGERDRVWNDAIKLVEIQIGVADVRPARHTYVVFEPGAIPALRIARCCAQEHPRFGLVCDGERRVESEPFDFDHPDFINQRVGFDFRIENCVREFGRK